MQILLHFESLLRRYMISILNIVGRANQNVNRYKDDIKLLLKVRYV